jgi:hypothetical protein
METLTGAQITDAILWTTVGSWPGILSFATPKIAVVALLIRILNPGTTHRVFLWTSALLCWTSLNVCVPLLLTSCNPAKSLWDVDITKKSCRSPRILIFYSIYAGCKRLSFHSFDIVLSNISNSFFRRCRFVFGCLPSYSLVYTSDEIEEEDCVECCIGYWLYVRVSSDSHDIP